MHTLAGSSLSSHSATLNRPCSARKTGTTLRPQNAANIGQGAPLQNTPAKGPPSLQSGHPDALRRRQQAEARRAAAVVEAETARRCNWWEGAKPSNLISARTPEALQAELSRDSQLVVVDFFAPWCSACRRLFPKLLQLAENNPDVLFVKVNGGDDVLSQFVESLGVDRLPYFHFYRNGMLEAHFAANLTKINLLRAELAAHKECNSPSCLI